MKRGITPSKQAMKRTYPKMPTRDYDYWVEYRCGDTWKLWGAYLYETMANDVADRLTREGGHATRVVLVNV